MIKKVYSTIAICVMCLSVVFGLTACGRDAAKIYGVGACVSTQENVGLVDKELANENKLIENDYVLQVGATYYLTIDYIAGGGSKYPILLAENVELKYDEEIISISTVVEREIGVLKHCLLTCKKEFSYSAILVEVDGKYECFVILSAE